VGVQAQRQESEARQRQSDINADEAPEILQSSMIAALKAQLSELETRQKGIANSLGTSHPQYVAMTSEITNVKERIATETHKLLASLEQANLVNVQRERAISSALETQKQRVLQLKQARAEAAVLQSDVATAQRNLDAVNQRLAVSMLEEDTNQGNVVMLAPATEPSGAASPNIIINTILGLFLGLVLGLGAALFRELSSRRIRSQYDVLQLTGAPVLARLGRLPPASLRLSKMASS
jgi:uncharacterized protein involved in exopolysaccharide biosynthesis